MAFNFGGLSSGLSGIGGVAVDIAAAMGGRVTAAGYRDAANSFGQAQYLAEQNALQSQVAGRLQRAQLARQVYMTTGAQEAITGANGFQIGGSAADIIRNTAQQGALAAQLSSEQTGININSYLAQADADRREQQQAEAAAKAAESSVTGGFLGAAFKAIGAGAAIAGAF
jgi:hypothetical protein